MFTNNHSGIDFCAWFNKYAAAIFQLLNSLRGGFTILQCNEYTWDSATNFSFYNRLIIFECVVDDPIAMCLCHKFSCIPDQTTRWYFKLNSNLSIAMVHH